MQLQTGEEIFFPIKLYQNPFQILARKAYTDIGVELKIFALISH